MSFNTQPPEGGWILEPGPQSPSCVSTHSRPKAAGTALFPSCVHINVSTHSRPKAAGKVVKLANMRNDVSTHSRPKAAGNSNILIFRDFMVSTHSRPKAAGFAFSQPVKTIYVSTHSRPKAAGSFNLIDSFEYLFQHTAARRRLVPLSKALLRQVSQP